MITLGIDTSNYTTSVALYDGTDYHMRRKILDVKKGMRGIRQSDGVFIHNKELPVLIEGLIKDVDIDAVGVSSKPRNLEGSYMPVFTVGHGYGKAIASALGVNYYEFSHQDGHIMAGIHSADAYSLLDAPFISVHLSGGTTEILKSEYDGERFSNEIIGGTLDISVGQLIDRVGVDLGMKFPCGKELDILANTTDKTIKLPYSIKDTYVNLSGVENKLTGLINEDRAVIARTVFVYIAELLKNTIHKSITNTKTEKILVAGGVASNSIIRNELIKEFRDNIYFASKELSSDNAVGIAILTHRGECKWKKGL